MHVDVEICRDTGIALPRAFVMKGRRVSVVEIIDQWFGSDYRYCKLKGDDGAIYILRVIEHSSDWQLTLFSSQFIQSIAASSGT